MKTQIAFRESFGALIDSQTSKYIDLASTSSVTSSLDFYCFGRKIVKTDSLAGLQLIASDITALSPIIVGLHRINCIDFSDNQDRGNLLKISKTIHSLLNKTVSGTKFERTDLLFIQDLKNCLNQHPTLRVYGNNNDAFDVTIAIRNMVNTERQELEEDFKDIIRNTFSDYGLLHIYVQKRYPFNGYFVLPSFADFEGLFQTYNKKPLYPNGPPISLGFGLPRECFFLNERTPTVVDDTVKNAYKTRIELPMPLPFNENW